MADDALQQLLKLAVEKIKEEAQGRICGNCRHCLRTFCIKCHNIQGEHLVIWRPDAVACQHYEGLA